MRCLLADDHDMFTDMFKSYLEAKLPVSVVVTVPSLSKALEAAAEQDFDLVLLDLRMPGMRLPDGIKKMREIQQGVPVAVISGTANVADGLAAMQAGAAGFLPKTLSGEELVAATARLLEGEQFIPSNMPGAIPSESGPSGGLDERPKQLTRRELAVLQELCAGKQNKEIGRALGIAEQTVKIHLQGIFRKLGAKNRADAVRIAMADPQRGAGL